MSISGANEFVKHKPGICFTEKMVGEFSPSDNRNEKTSCEFTLTIESNDIKAMLEFDPDHEAQISGTVTCPVLSSSPLSVSEGQSKSTSFEAKPASNRLLKIYDQNAAASLMCSVPKHDHITPPLIRLNKIALEYFNSLVAKRKTSRYSLRSNTGTLLQDNTARAKRYLGTEHSRMPQQQYGTVFLF